MIYDKQDIATKLYIAHMTRIWVQTGNNALILLQNPKVKEITDADLSWNSDDDLVWTTLYLIGVGLLRYIVSKNGDRMDIALRPKWKKPQWLWNKGSRQRMKNHVNLIMEAEREVSGKGIPLTPLIPSLDMVKYHSVVLEPPNEPNRDTDKERALIQRNRKLSALKRQFHRSK